MDMGRAARILVIDDDARSRRLVRGLLEPMGLAVEEADGGAAGLARLADGGFDTVLLDLNMPGIGGFEVLERLRLQWPMEELPVILVTGEDDAEARARGLALRANEFLPKPVDQHELLARVGMMLAYRRSRLELDDCRRELERLRRSRSRLMDAILRDAPTPLAMDALDLARLEDGSLKPREHRVSLAEIALDRVADHQGAARQRDVLLAAGMGGRTDPVIADPRLLGRVIDRLVGAAIAATPPGGRVDLFLSMSERGGSAQLEVRGHPGGPGDAGGDPWGAAMMEAMHGTLRARGSAAGDASTTITLPVAPAAVPAGAPSGRGGV